VRALGTAGFEGGSSGAVGQVDGGKRRAAALSRELLELCHEELAISSRPV
jgi:hypothetical protein